MCSTFLFPQVLHKDLKALSSLQILVSDLTFMTQFRSWWCNATSDTSKKSFGWNSALLNNLFTSKVANNFVGLKQKTHYKSSIFSSSNLTLSLLWKWLKIGVLNLSKSGTKWCCPGPEFGCGFSACWYDKIRWPNGAIWGPNWPAKNIT